MKKFINYFKQLEEKNKAKIEAPLKLTKEINEKYVK